MRIKSFISNKDFRGDKKDPDFRKRGPLTLIEKLLLTIFISKAFRGDKKERSRFSQTGTFKGVYA